MLAKYSIKDLERLSGIKAHTLRIWEQRYEILAPERTDTNIRYYSNHDLKRILNISLLNNNGYKISSIARLSHDHLLMEVEKLLNTYLKESDQVDNLVLCLMDMDEARFEKTILNSVQQFGFENSIEKIVFPFLRHMGNLWQVGVISSAQEHYLCSLIRQKLVVGIDRLEAVPAAGAKSYLFFLPEDELHEMGLLYACYLAKARGHRCIYLGQSLPFEDLVGISKTLQPDYLVSIFTANAPGMNVNLFLNACHQQITGPRFLVSGRLLFSNDCGPLALLPERFSLFKDFEEFKSHL